MVVEAGALAGHPQEDPGVHAVVFVDELVPALDGVDANERLPYVRPARNVARDAFELLRREDSVAR